MRSSDKGFFLVDSLLAVFILSAICILCFSIYNLIDRYERGYLNYQERSNRRYEEILPQLNRCEGCTKNESD